MRNKQQVAEDLVKWFKDSSDSHAVLPIPLFNLLLELKQVMEAYNRGKLTPDEMRAKAIAESAR